MRLVSSVDPVLHQVANPIDLGSKWNVDDVDLDVFALAYEMRNLMWSRRGIGLAAPQIGLPIRLFLMDEKTYINPNIISASIDQDRIQEGCLSFPGLYLKISRPISVDVEYTDMKGQLVREKYHNIWARCFAHELDHLNGVVFTSKVGGAALMIAKEKARKFKGDKNV